MPDEAGYPASMRAAAALGLLVAGALAFILLDVMSGGKLTGALAGGCGCDDGTKAPADA